MRSSQKHEVRKLLLPSSLLAHHFWSILQPCENGMVGPHQELSFLKCCLNNFIKYTTASSSFRVEL